MTKAGNSQIMRTITLLITIFSLSFPAYAQYSGGRGVPNDPYRIATAADLIALGETPEDYDKHFLLTADIDLDPNLPGRKVFDRAVIAPNRNDSNWPFGGTPFRGVFDGNGHTISHLTISGGGYLGLFGSLSTHVSSSGAVKNLGVVNVSITGSGNSIGGLVGYNVRPVTQCYSTGTVSGTSLVGGLVGQNQGSVTQCYSMSVVNGTGSFVGGLVGSNGNVSRVNECYSTGSVSGMSEVGGLVGRNVGSIIHSVWDTEASGQVGSAGGVGLTTAEMMDPNMLGLNGFADDPNWVLDVSRDYPRLAWEGTPGQIIPEPNIDWLEGQGTPQDPYQIVRAEQLISLRRASAVCDRYFVLGADIDFDPALPGGEVFTQALIPAFTGALDGNGHAISHLTIKGGSRLGLFDRLEFGAQVRDLRILDVNITSSDTYAGALAAMNSGAVIGCCSTGVVRGNWYVGGLVGQNNGSVTQCGSRGVISGAGAYVGGLVGRNWFSTVTQCYAVGVASGGSYVGGLVGYNGERCSVSLCYSMGSVRGTDYVGGLVGWNQASTREGVTQIGEILQCYSAASVAADSNFGGLSGVNRGAVTQCFWDIQTSGQTISAGGTGKATAEMQKASTFLEAGWDFVGETANGTDDIWWIDEGQNYPKLWWESLE